MIWIYAEDMNLYLEENIKMLCEKYGKDNVILFPTREDITKIDARQRNITLYLAPYPVFQEFRFFIPQKYEFYNDSPLTSQERLLDVKEDTALALRLGIEIVKPNVSLDTVGGAFELKKFTEEFLRAEKNGYRSKAFFLTGLAGTGKTFFAKAFAGSTDRTLIFLNLSVVMAKPEPIVELYKIHDYLNLFQNTKFLILIDEIEKMIGNGSPNEKQMLGAMLTLINEIDSPVSKYKDLDVVYLATANNLSTILAENPEFVRRGRFDELFFVNLPTEIEAVDMFDLYIKKYNLKEHLFGENPIFSNTFELVLKIYDVHTQEDNPAVGRFVYTPAEIETFCKLLSRKIKADIKLTEEVFVGVIRDVIPITKTAQESAKKMLAQAELFKQL